MALLLHDIARSSINNPQNGHTNHCKEGSVILTPLGLPTSYSLWHAYAKQRLTQFCPSYSQLISNTSKNSLLLQIPDISANELLHDGQAFPYFIYKIMLMRRLIDDMSKVPLDSEKDLYFNNDDILILLKTQMQNRLNEHKVSIEDLDLELNSAISLLVRAQEYSNEDTAFHSAYEQYADILSEIVLESKKVNII